MAQQVLIIAVVALTLVAAVCDFRTKRLPNWLTVPGFIVAIAYHLVTGVMDGGWSGGLHGLLFALGGFATGFGILLVLWLIGGGGAGDVKLMGALGAWLGAPLTLYVFFVSTLFVVLGSTMALSYQMITNGMGYVRRRFLRSQNPDALPRNAEQRVTAQREYKTRRRLMPYGVPVALATWTVLAWAFWPTNG